MINTHRINNVDIFRKGGPTGMAYTEEPTYLTFAVEFVTVPINMPHTMTMSSPLFITDGQYASYSATQYLKMKGYPAEYERLSKFIEIMKDVSTNKPWYFQKVTGVEKMWANSTNMLNNFKGKDIVLEFTTLESLDLKMTYMADLYRQSIYDTYYMRELVPDNLRWFNMKLYITEFRNISSLIFNLSPNTIDPKKSYVDNSQALLQAHASYFQKNATCVAFDCHQCEFDFSGSMPGTEFSVSEFDTPAASSFKINVNAFTDISEYGFYAIKTAITASQHERNDSYYNPYRTLRGEPESKAYTSTGGASALGALVGSILG